MVRSLRRVLPVLAGVLIATSAVARDDYRTPPDDIVRILDAKPLPSVSLDPTQRWMLMSESRGMPSIGDMAQPMLRLAGQRINPDVNGRHGGYSVVGLTVKPVAGGQARRIALPDDARISSPTWSPDGERFAFLLQRPDGLQLWVGDPATASARSLSDTPVNAIMGGMSWMPDGLHLLVRFVPSDRGAAPERSAIPDGPVAQESSGRASPVRTYQDLLSDPYDEALFDHYFKAQLALVDTRSGLVGTLRDPAIYMQTSPSPDGLALLVSRIERPYSYMVPMWSFPQTVEVWDLESGETRVLTTKPLADEVPIGGVVTGPRSHQWRATEDTTEIYWVEALDGGDPKREVDERDRIMRLADPMHGEAVEVARLEDRFSGMTWIEGGGGDTLVSEYDRDERWRRTWRMNMADRDHGDRLVFSLSAQDRYGNPGRPYMVTNSAGRAVARATGQWVFMSGSGATPEGDRPFFSRVNLETGETRELWRCEGACYETFVEMLPDHELLTRYETPDEPPNYMLRDTDSGTRTPLTSFAHPAPQLRDVRKELVKYTRDDGVELSATLYLPPGYEEGRDAPLPLLVWAYPLEYNDASLAGQVRGSPYRFTRIGGSSHLFMLLQGYAILDGATMPVVGSDPETVNDTFLDQIVESAAAAIEYAADRGVADPDRVGVGGHSYGAFMTANLLAHSDLFRAGVARSGAYNRTLTPFGFQSERRTFWEAPDVYFELSPFMHADDIDEPILLIHGERDNNSGTFPIQSERLYHAVKGHGGTVRLVMLPYESHGYRAEESIKHVLAEMIDWFNLHVKGSAEGTE